MGYRVMASIGLVLVVISLLICAFTSYFWQPFVYGVLGGKQPVGFQLYFPLT